jgi:TatD DNase family protein
MYIDTHCHLNMVVKKEFDVPLEQKHYPMIKAVLDQARDAGVETIINVGTSLVESINCVEIAKRFDNVHATVGLHPCDCTPDWRKDFDGLKKLLADKESNKIVGIGEIGLDFYHKPFDRSRQEDALKAQIELGLEHGLPFSFHVRDAGEEFLMVVEQYVKDMKQAVNHCFSQDKDFAKTIVEWGFYAGIDGPVSYTKNHAFREVVATIPLENLVIETDAPFLPPQQFRGKQNLPAYIPLFAPTLAEVKGVTVEELARVTSVNAKVLFGLDES